MTIDPRLIPKVSSFVRAFWMFALAFALLAVIQSAGVLWVVFKVETFEREVTRSYDQMQKQFESQLQGSIDQAFQVPIDPQAEAKATADRKAKEREIRKQEYDAKRAALGK